MRWRADLKWVPSFATAIVLGLSAFAIAVPGNQNEQPTIRFRWNWKAAQELSPRDSLRKAQLPQADKEQIAAVLLEELSRRMTPPNDVFGSDLRANAWATASRVTDLNGDGVPEVMTQLSAACSPVGNCPFEIYRKPGRDTSRSWMATRKRSRSKRNGRKDFPTLCWPPRLPGAAAV